MSIALERREVVSILVPVTEVPDLLDPVTRRTVAPATVFIELSRTVRPNREHTNATVHVYGPRRLKSGELGKEISSFNWQTARNEGFRAGVDRPDWLTAVIAEHLPEGWAPKLVELAGGTR
ncbi:hypothetical protein ABZ438_07705 [Streptomyces sp. NPDC005786]|uniref:hypothetical protein n=1 Tax=Streptomyces sp. NPDC005786 TaxID=3154891 RepID=UPI0033D85DA9